MTQFELKAPLSLLSLALCALISSCCAQAPDFDELEEEASPAEATVGSLAPNFELKDLEGNVHKLSDYRGKTIVLEWFNPGCPFVVKAHEDGPLKEMPGAGEDVVWLAINSGAPGKQGASPEQNAKSTADWGMSYPLLMDPEGTVGKSYKAKTTPHMYVIDEDFVLRYAGALDNAPMGNTSGDYSNYVQGAIEAIAKGETCPEPVKPWGCGVKYAN
ncbi:MAG: redoxin domain-containing protein [Planctomycetes bacterium]|nr:redoxin domain-containing protein [Planctomycetota bacterium]